MSSNYPNLSYNNISVFGNGMMVSMNHLNRVDGLCGGLFLSFFFHSFLLSIEIGFICIGLQSSALLMVK